MSEREKRSFLLKMIYNELENLCQTFFVDQESKRASQTDLLHLLKYLRCGQNFAEVSSSGGKRLQLLNRKLRSLSKSMLNVNKKTGGRVQKCLCGKDR